MHLPCVCIKCDTQPWQGRQALRLEVRCREELQNEARRQVRTDFPMICVVMRQNKLGSHVLRLRSRFTPTAVRTTSAAFKHRQSLPLSTSPVISRKLAVADFTTTPLSGNSSQASTWHFDEHCHLCQPVRCAAPIHKSNKEAAASPPNRSCATCRQ